MDLPLPDEATPGPRDRLRSAPMDDRKVRWGILGCGGIATSAIAPAIRWSRKGVLRAVGSRTAERAAERARVVEAPVAYGSYDALLADPEIDAVYIGLPNGEHARWALAAASAGKHVLCEKSVALTAEDATRMGAAFRGRGLRLVEAFMVRHHPQWSCLRAMLPEIGPVDHVRAVLRARHLAPGDHRWSATLGGGALFDVTCYPVNLARFVFGAEPVRVRATARWRSPGVDAATDALLELGDGRIASVHGSLDGAPEESAVISGARGRITLERPFVPGWSDTEIVVETEEGKTSHVVPGANHYLHMVEHFEALVRDPALALHPAEDGVAGTATLAAIALAARTGSTVPIRR